MKEKLIIIIDLSLRKRPIAYKRSNWITSSEKKKKKTITLNYFFFITIFSFGGPLVVWESAASEDSESLLLRSPWAGNGRVARTISIVEGTSFSLGGSWGIAGGLVALGATPLLASTSFSATPYCWVSSGKLLEEGGALAGLPFPSSTTSEPWN